MHAATPSAVNFSYAEPADPKLRRLAIRGIERLTGQPRLKRLYQGYTHRPVPGEDFFTAAVRLLDLRVDVDSTSLDAIPKSGPLVVVANHPFGVVDGVVLGSLISRVRPDHRVVAHGLLARAPEAAERILPIDFSGTARSSARNVQSRRTAIRWLHDGHVIIVFPAGGVSTAPKPFARTAVDDSWKPFTARLVQAASAPVLPVRFAGQNSRLFQVASHLSQTLRMSLLFNEVHNKIGARIGVTIGEVVPYPMLAHLQDRQALADHLRQVTYALEPNLAFERGNRRAIRQAA